MDYSIPLRRHPTGCGFVVGVTTFADHDPRKAELGPIHSIDIHLDADDPNHVFMEYPEGATKRIRKLIDAFNAPFKKSNRLRIRRALNFQSLCQIWDPHFEAAQTLPKLGISVPNLGTDS